MSISYQERLARIRINSFLYFRADWLARLIELFGSAENILKQNADTLAQQANMNPTTAAHFLKEAFAINPEEELEKTEKYGGHILVPEDALYPQAFRNIKEAPIALYVLGKLPQEQACVAMVGTRKITAYGRRAAHTLASGLAQAGAVIVSGLARGIDSTCHAAAVQLDKPTVAVIGTGIGRCYPPENRDLARAILQHDGAIISELPFHKPPHAFHFPRRNRLIAALSEVVVVIEGEVKSGALITAKLALEMGKEVLAVPGPIDSAQSGGPNQLIADGAGVVTSVKDIIDYIPQPQLFQLQLSTPTPAPSAVEGLSDIEQKVLTQIGAEELALDQLVEALHLSVPEVAGALFELEVKGIIACNNGLYAKSKF